MAGLELNTPQPEQILLRNAGKVLVLRYADIDDVALSAEFLRVHSPSAEVRGHGIGNAVLQTHKEEVAITGIEPIGHYAIKLVFSDGHDSGLYSWDILHHFATQHTTLWQAYLSRLQTAGITRKD